MLELLKQDDLLTALMLDLDPDNSASDAHPTTIMLMKNIGMIFLKSCFVTFFPLVFVIDFRCCINERPVNDAQNVYIQSVVKLYCPSAHRLS